MAKKDVTAIVSGAGWIASFADKLIKALREKGVSDEQIHKLVTEDGDVPVAKIAEALVETMKIVSFQRDMTKEGWTLLEDVPFDGQPFIPDIVGFLKPNESYVNGDIMRSRAKELNANLGQRHAEYLLNHQDLIPKEWQGKYYLVFSGTIWQLRLGGRNVLCLHWGGGDRWYPFFYWPRGGWGSGVRLVSARK